AGDALGQHGDVRRARLVVPAAGDQCRDADLTEPGGHVPVAQAPGNRAELARSPHGLVDIGAHPGEGPLHTVRPWVLPAQVPPVELGDRPRVFGTGEIAGRLVAVEHVTDRFVEFGPQLRAVGDPARNAGRRTAEDQAFEPRPAVERVLQGEPAAPRVA